MTTENKTPIRIPHTIILATMLLSFACRSAADEAHDAKVALEQIRADKKADESAKQKAAHEANPCPGKWFFDLHVVCPAKDTPNINYRCTTESERRHAWMPETGGTPYRGRNGQAFTVPVELKDIRYFAWKGWRDSKEECEKARVSAQKTPDKGQTGLNTPFQGCSHGEAIRRRIGRNGEEISASQIGLHPH